MAQLRLQVADLLWGPIATGGLVLSAGVVGLVAGQPLLFPSLGPTALLHAEFPEQRSARFYNTVVGHLVGLAMGYLAVIAVAAESAPPVIAAHQLHPSRVIAGTVAVTLTWLVLWILRATHPPAAATTLLAALGAFRPNVTDALDVVGGVLVIAVLGESVRWARERVTARRERGRATSASP